MKKVITTTHIDNCSHGYFSVSKKDILLLGIADKISGYSGLTLNRVYLEEDCDGALLYEAAKTKGYELRIKDGYNPNFKITHNYSLDLFNWVPQVDQIVYIGSDAYQIHEIRKNHIIVERNSVKYWISKSNPFKLITSVQK